MTNLNLDGARRYALGRLERELPAWLTYHSLWHTECDVLPAVERLAAREGVSGEDLVLLKTAALLHDVGFVEQHTDHEEAGVRIARQALPELGYSPVQIGVICDIIMATQLPQRPYTLLEQIMADADLDVLGRDDFFPRGRALRYESAALGLHISETEWYRRQLNLLESHQYFTAAAREIRDAAQQRNAQELRRRLESSQPGSSTQAKGDAHVALDKVLLLQSVSLFADTPDPVLSDVADLLQTCQVKAGETIFQKDEPGDCMYIIFEGRVRVHDGERTLNYLGVADVFGEMALLDADPRVASVTAEENTSLYRLDRAAFYDLMAQRAEVAREIIRMLSRRLRARVRDMAQDYEYMQQMARITAAAVGLEAGQYDPCGLEEVGQRTDELGQLARVFRRMADEVQAREARLRQQVCDLRIQIDEVKKARQVSEITESDYFRELKQRVDQLRNRDSSR